MQREPDAKRAVAFIDASNLRASARRAFGDSFGNINPVAVAEEVCAAQGWNLAGVSYYLGVPDVRVSEDGHYSWMKRCARWRKQGVRVFTRTLLQDERGTAREKGIDVRLALDAVAQFRQDAYDVALIFSQDQDFSELAAELKALARELSRWVLVVSAFPVPADAAAEPTGISGTLAMPLAEGDIRKALDTPENRKRTLALRPPPQLYDAPAARDDEADAADALPVRSAGPALPVPMLRQAERPPPAPRRWATAASALYLFTAVCTFGYLTWTSRAVLAKPAQGLPLLAGQAANALIWPVYWLEGSSIAGLKDRLTQLQDVFG